jgi:hypothetical protein
MVRFNYITMKINIKMEGEEEKDYSSRTEFKACQWKWETIDRIWEDYIKYNERENIIIPIGVLTIKGRKLIEIDQIIEGFREDGCFNECPRDTENYKISKINHNKFKKVHQYLKSENEKYSKFQDDRKDSNQKKDGILLNDLVVGPLIYKKDGLIYYKQTLLEMRFQLRTICILFMEKHKEFVDYTCIRDEIIPAHKRSTTSFETITKYVSELHKLLRLYFKRKVIFNQEKEGYIFDIKRES